MKGLALPELPILKRDWRASLHGRSWGRPWLIAGVALIIPIAIGALLLSQHFRPDNPNDIPGVNALRAALYDLADRQGMLTIAWGIAAFIITLITPALIGPTFAQEHELRTLDALFLTPLSGTRIAVEKLLRAALPIVMAMLYTLPFGLAFALDAPDFLPQYLLMLLLLVLTGLLIGAVSLYVATFYRRTYAATLAAYLVNACLFVPLPVLVSLEIYSYYDTPGRGWLVITILGLAPVIGLLLLWGVADLLDIITRRYPARLLAPLPRVLLLTAFTLILAIFVGNHPLIGEHPDLLLLGNPMSGVMALTDLNRNIFEQSWLFAHVPQTLLICYLSIIAATIILVRQTGRRIEMMRKGAK